MPIRIANRESHKDMSRRERAYQLWGWVLFLVCAIFFIVSAVQNHDIPYLIGSIVFLLACVLFLIPFVTKKKSTSGNKKSNPPE